MEQNKENGITLIALVITIVVLLILAGITINLVLGEDGIIKRVKEAKEIYKNAETNEITDLTYFEASIIPGKVAKTLDGIQYVGDGIGNIIPVPVGFKYLEGTKNTGFVIINEIDGNEFVWIPCTIDGRGESIKYDRYVFLSNQSADGIDSATNSLKIKHTSNGEYASVTYTEEIPTDEEESIRKNEGFYIGRYETGITGYSSVNTSTSNTLTEYTGYTGGNVIIQKEQQVWNYITRDKAKKVSEELYKKIEGANVNSKLCSSYAWDTALKFIETNYPMYPKDSIVGNYSDKYFTFGKPAKTGQTEAVNNIYDLGGNVYEWTTEYCNREGTPCTNRGGYYYYSSKALPAAVRAWNGITNINNNFGFRITLFL